MAEITFRVGDRVMYTPYPSAHERYQEFGTVTNITDFSAAFGQVMVQYDGDSYGKLTPITHLIHEEPTKLEPNLPGQPGPRS
jgi:hypothetical protein